VLSLAGACTPANPQPSATPIPPTSTSIPPTPTPIPPTPTPGPPDQILFFGNSTTYYNAGAQEHLKLLAAFADPSLSIEVQLNQRMGTSLKGLLEIYGTSDIQEGTWDVVVLQGSIHAPWFSIEDFFEAVRIFDQAIQDAGAQTILFMPWEMIKRDTRTIHEIDQAHSQIASEVGVKVAPVGLAWQRSIQERPDLELYDPDGLHPNATGTYLTACVLYAVIYDKSPEGIDYQPFDMFTGNKAMEILYKDWELTDDEVAFIQRIAWETVVEYQAQNE
jgi:hypothetical protein